MFRTTSLSRFQKKWIVVFFLPLILLGSRFVHAQTQQLPLLILNGTKGQYPLGLYMEVLEDPSGELGIEEVSSAAYNDRFIRNDQIDLSRGFTKSALWGRFKIENAATNTNWQLVLDDTRMGLIDVYVAGAGGQEFAHQQSGRLVPFNDRHSPYYFYVFDIPLRQGQVQEIYVRMKTDTTFYAPLSLWSADKFFNYYQSQILLLGLFYGAMLIMLMYNLMLFLMLRDVNYLYLSLYILFFGFFLAIEDGFAAQYLWPASITQNSTRMLISGIVVIISCLFMLNFLQIQRYSRTLAHFIKSIIATSLVLVIVSQFDSLDMVLPNLLGIILAITMVISGIFVLSKGYQPARLYLIAWTASSFALLGFTLTNLGILKNNWFFEHGLHLSALLLITLWSLALADRVSLLQSESRQAYQKAKLGEYQISKFLNALPFGIMVHTRDNRLAYLNKSAQEDIGFSPADGDYSITNPKLQDVMRGWGLSDVDSGKVIDINDLPLVSVFNGKNITMDNLEVNIRGVRVPLEIHTSPVVEDDQQINLAVTFFQDISDRRKQEADLRESHLRLNGILENAADAIISVDEEQKIVLFNKQAEIVFGYQAYEVFEHPIDILIPERFRASHGGNIKMFELNERQTRSMGEYGEISGLRKNGEEFPARASISSTHRQSGKILTVFLRDISEEKKQSNALWETQSRYLSLYENTPLGIFIADPEGRIVQANRAFQEMVGYSEAELKEMPYFDIIHPDDLETSQSHRDELLKNPNKSNTIEKRFIHKNGQAIWVARTASVISDAQGKTLNTYAIINDISDRKFNETQLREYHERLEDLVVNRTMNLQQSREHLAALNQASRLINASIMAPEQVYIAIHTAISWMTSTDVFTIILADKAHGTFEEVYLSTPEGRQTGTRGTLESSFIERVFEKGTSLHMIEFPDESDKNEYDSWPKATQQIKSGLAVLLHGSSGDIGLLITQRIEPNAYSHSEQELLESFAAHAAIAIENTSLYRQAQEHAAVEERRRLARELHDSVAQLLYSMILMNSGWEKMAKENRLSSPAEAFKKLGVINLQALKEMRMLIHHLRPSNLEEVGLVNAIRQRLETVEERAGIKAQLEFNGELPPLQISIEDELYAIVQEALNNSLRHASASKITVVIELVEDQLVLWVQDNGVGFEIQNIKQGIGLSSMKERTTKIDGEIEITSSPGQGTLVKVKVEI